MEVFNILVVVCLIYVTSLSAQVPIPTREVGFVYKKGRDDAPVHLDVYVDLICPDSKEAWQTLLDVGDHYGPTKLQFKAHIFPLPYHRNAWMATKGLHVINGMTSGSKSFEWITLLYKNIDKLNNSATNQFSQDKMVSEFAKLATSIGIKASTFVTILLNDKNIEHDVRVSWKYACTRGVAATPIFMVNDIVASTAQQTWTIKQWKEFIDPILNPPA